MTVEFGGATPILSVRDLPIAIDYYVNVLGFAVDWGGPHVIASVSRGRCALFLVEQDQGHPGAWVWTGVNDVEKLHEEYRARGAKIRQAPTNFDWALEMQIEDPDGNVIRFGSEPRRDEPFGPWLDMHGVRWQYTDGGWQRMESSV